MYRQPVWTLTTLLAVAAILTPTPAKSFYPNGRYGKRAEHVMAERAADRFWSGSRYGRHDPDIEVSPRADRFYGGLRYGKRDQAELGTSAAVAEGNPPQTDLAPAVPNIIVAATELMDGSQLECTYTGVTNIYRCSRRDVGRDDDAGSSSN